MMDFDWNKIERNPAGFITDSCLRDMRASLPIRVIYDGNSELHQDLRNEQDLEDCLLGFWSPFARRRITHYCHID